MRAVAAFYYVSFIVIGNYILLNLFLAVLIDSFLKEGDKEQTSQEVEDSKMKELESAIGSTGVSSSTNKGLEKRSITNNNGRSSATA